MKKLLMFFAALIMSGTLISVAADEVLYSEIDGTPVSAAATEAFYSKLDQILADKLSVSNLLANEANAPHLGLLSPTRAALVPMLTIPISDTAVSALPAVEVNPPFLSLFVGR